MVVVMLMVDDDSTTNNDMNESDPVKRFSLFLTTVSVRVLAVALVKAAWSVFAHETIDDDAMLMLMLTLMLMLISDCSTTCEKKHSFPLFPLVLPQTFASLFLVLCLKTNAMSSEARNVRLL